MSLSSTSSSKETTSENSTQPRRLKLGVEIGVVVLIFLFVEIWVRLIANSGALQLPRTWPHPDYDHKLALLQPYADDLQVLFLGNSQIMRGIDPAAFSEQVHDLEGIDIHSFNGSQEGVNAEVMAVLAQYIYAPMVQPETIIFGITARDLNINSAAINGKTRQFMESPGAISATNQAYLTPIIEFLDQHWYTFRYRHILSEWLWRFRFDELVTHLSLTPTTSPPPEPDFDNLGFRPASSSLSDADWSALRDPEHENYERLGNFDMQGAPLDALHDLIQHTREEGITLIIFNLPVHEEFFRYMPGQDAGWQRYRDQLRAELAEEDVIYWDLQTLVENGTLTDSDFADFNHLNFNGAEKLSRELARLYVQTVIAQTTSGAE